MILVTNENCFFMFILEMSSKKTIAINPKLFELSGKKSKAKTLKKERKPKPNRNLIRPNTLKKIY